MSRRLKVGLILTGLFIAFWSWGVHISPKVAKLPPAEPLDATAIYNDVNVARHNAGVSVLSQNPTANEAATQKCQDMVTNDYYSHINPKTNERGYLYSQKLFPNGILFNENLNEGDLRTNQAWVDSWLNSPGHKATMLEPKFTDTGVAICHRPSSPAGTYTVVQEFIQIPVVTSTPVQQSGATNCITTTYPAIHYYGTNIPETSKTTCD